MRTGLRYSHTSQVRSPLASSLLLKDFKSKLVFLCAVHGLNVP